MALDVCEPFGLERDVFELHKMTSRVTAVRVLPNGWEIHGKTGTGSPTATDDIEDENHDCGWFVGWAIRSGRRVVFARLIQDEKHESVRAGLRARDDFLADLPSILDSL